MGTGISALEAVPAAVCAFLHHPDSYTETISFAIRMGGDTDTIASMAGAISGARLGLSAIPRPWLDRVEAVAHLRHLADELAARSSTAGETGGSWESDE